MLFLELHYCTVATLKCLIARGVGKSGWSETLEELNKQRVAKSEGVE